MGAGAHAEMPPFYELGPRPDKDVLAGGLLYFHAPRYAGSAESRNYYAPSATAILTNGLFADVVSGIGYNASADPRFEYGARMTLGLGREETGELAGMGRIPRTVNTGVFANYNLSDAIQVQSSLRYGSGYQRNGTLVDVGASWDFFKRGYFSVGVEGSVSFADHRYMQSFYGVSESQASASRYRPYSPGAGRQWTVVGLAVNVPLHERVLAAITLERSRLSGTAAASPYARERDSNSIQAVIAYAF